MINAKSKKQEDADDVPYYKMSKNLIEQITVLLDVAAENSKELWTILNNEYKDSPSLRKSREITSYVKDEQEARTMYDYLKMVYINNQENK